MLYKPLLFITLNFNFLLLKLSFEKQVFVLPYIFHSLKCHQQVYEHKTYCVRLTQTTIPTTLISNHHFLTGTFSLLYHRRILAANVYIHAICKLLHQTHYINTLLSHIVNILYHSFSTSTIHSHYILQYILPNSPPRHSTRHSFYVISSCNWFEDIQMNINRSFYNTYCFTEGSKRDWLDQKNAHHKRGKHLQTFTNIQFSHRFLLSQLPPSECDTDSFIVHHFIVNERSNIDLHYSISSFSITYTSSNNVLKITFHYSNTTLYLRCNYSYALQIIVS